MLRLLLRDTGKQTVPLPEGQIQQFLPKDCMISIPGFRIYLGTWYLLLPKPPHHWGELLSMDNKTESLHIFYFIVLRTITSPASYRTIVGTNSAPFGLVNVLVR